MLPIVNFGDLRHRVTIQQPTYTTNNLGERVPGWSMIGRAWVALNPVIGREVELARTFAATVTHKITMRYRAGLTPNLRLVLGSRIFAINGIVDLEERHRWLNVFAT